MGLAGMEGQARPGGGWGDVRGVINVPRNRVEGG